MTASYRPAARFHGDPRARVHLPASVTRRRPRAAAFHCMFTGDSSPPSARRAVEGPADMEECLDTLVQICGQRDGPPPSLVFPENRPAETSWELPAHRRRPRPFDFMKRTGSYCKTPRPRTQRHPFSRENAPLTRLARRPSDQRLPPERPARRSAPCRPSKETKLLPEGRRPTTNSWSGWQSPPGAASVGGTDSRQYSHDASGSRRASISSQCRGPTA